MEEPRVVALPAYHVVKLRYRGPPPEAPEFLEHWRRFNEWAEAHAKSPVEDVWAIGYASPGPVASPVIDYDSCVPVPEGFVIEDGPPGLELASLPGGRFVLCAGEIKEDFQLLLRAAQRYAMSHGLAIERGWIDIYRPHPGDADVHPVDVGYRIHD